MNNKLDVLFEICDTNKNNLIGKNDEIYESNMEEIFCDVVIKNKTVKENFEQINKVITENNFEVKKISLNNSKTHDDLLNLFICVSEILKYLKEKEGE